MKDYSLFVDSAYYITFAVIVIFGACTFWQFYKNSKKLNGIKNKKNGKNFNKKNVSKKNFRGKNLEGKGSRSKNTNRNSAKKK